MDFFIVYFLVLLVVLAAIVGYNFTQQSIPKTTKPFKVFQIKYLIPYLFMTRPYVFALYKSYNFSIGEIGLLFLCGFCSSMIFGTFIGSLSDKIGRKLSCCLYAIGYILDNVTKHFNNFYILIVGRILGGISTSILFSAFESWMINEHFEGGHDKEWISFTFFLQVFFNSIMAILAGLIANVVTSFFGSMLATFDTAVILLSVGMVLIILLWKENYGDKQANVMKSFVEGAQVLVKDKGVLLLGICQSFFEAAMYIFVFMWTPVLESCFPDGINHGMIFAIYMVSVMAGSSVFNLLSQRVKKEIIVCCVFLVAAVALGIPIVLREGYGFVVFTAFNVFEFCVGMFWPSMGSMKSVYIPENVRSTVMNYFRIPTNLFVLLTFLFIEKLPYAFVFAICSVLLLISCACAAMIIVFFDKERKYVKVATIDEPTHQGLDGAPASRKDIELEELDIEQDLNKAAELV